VEWASTVEAFDLARIKTVCERDGICLIKGFFTPEEMTRIATGMTAAAKTLGDPLPDPMKAADLAWVPLHAQILEAARALLGDGLTYYLNGAVNYEPEIGALTLSPYTALHVDAAGQPENLAAEVDRGAEVSFPAYRFAIYTQDYTNASGGLRVVPGSHRWTTDYDRSATDEFTMIRLPPPSQPEADPEDFLATAPTRPGDLVIWNLSLVHSAGSKRLKADPERCLHPREEAELSKRDPDQFLPPPGPRNAIFFDYGAPVQATDLYIKFGTQTRLHKRMPAFAIGDVGAKTRERLEADRIIPREDGKIVSLSYEIEQIKTGTGDADRTRAVCEDLFARAQRHTEFSPHFSLFDREAFTTLAGQNWKHAAGYVQQQVMARIRQTNDL